MRCRAHRCPEEDIPDEHVFCARHWDLLGPDLRRWLCRVYGSEEWRHALEACVSRLRTVEGVPRRSS